MGARFSTSNQSKGKKGRYLTAEQAHLQASRHEVKLSQEKKNRQYMACHEAIDQAVQQGFFFLIWPQPSLSGNPMSNQDYLTIKQRHDLIDLGYRIKTSDNKGPVTILW